MNQSVRLSKLALLVTLIAKSAIPSLAQMAPISFVARRDFSVGLTPPVAIASADLNSDGKLDIVTVNITSNSAWVLLGNGDGTFQPAVSYSAMIAGASPNGLQIGDFNGDGKPDLLVTSTPANGTGLVGFSMLLGNGDGTFQPQIVTNLGANSLAFGIGDFNGDGKLDFAFPVGVPQLGDSAMDVMLGNGDGTFQSPIISNPGPFPSPDQIVLADVNGDGKTDLVFGHNASPTPGVSVLLGDGDGTFQPVLSTSVSTGVSLITVADFTGDGRLDVAFASGKQFAVVPGSGDGTFQPPIYTNFPPPASYYFLVAADVNGDGKMDLVIPSVAVLLGNGDGTFQIPGLTSEVVSLTYVLKAATVGDFNGDGQLDVTTCWYTGGYGWVSLVLGRGDGTFEVTSQVATFRGPGAATAAVGDFNSDSKPDIVEHQQYTSEYLDTFLGKGDGSFQTPIQNPLLSPNCRLACFLATADFDQDGKADIVINSSGQYSGQGNIVAVLLGNGNGTFQETDYAGGTSNASAVLVGDFNGDGNPDILAAGDSFAVFLNQGNGTFGFPLTSGGGAAGVAVGDFNGDSRLDVAATNGTSLDILLGNGDGSFSPGASYGLGSAVYSLAVGDVNGDGILDIVSSATNNSIVVLLGNSDGTFTTGSTYPIVEFPAAITVTDVNGDGNPDLIVSESDSIAVLAGNGNGTFQPVLNFGTVYPSGTLGIADFDGDGGLDLTNGTEVLFNRPSGPAAVLSPGSLNFGNTAVGSPVTLIVMLSNAGTQALSIGSIRLTGPQSSDFTQSNTCGATLTVGANCTIVVTFTPGATGSRTATLAATDSAPTSPQNVALSGVGVTSSVTLTPGLLSFSSLALGTTSPPLVTTLANGGSTAVQISSIGVTGTNAGDFAQTNNCSTSLSSGSSCSIHVTFTPVANGSRSAVLTVADNAANSPQNVTLVGGNAGVALGLSPLGSTSVTVAAGATATYTLSIGGAGFTGMATLSCTGAPKGAGCSLPASESVDSTTASTFSVAVATTSRLMALGVPGSLLPLSWIWPVLVAGLVFLPLNQRRVRLCTRRARLLPLYLVALVCSCGGGGSGGGGSTGSQANPNGTPAGTYAVTITATSGIATQSLPLTLIVQ